MYSKNHYYVALCAFVVVVAGVFYYKNAHNSGESELLMENVEALTEKKEGGSSDTWPCWSDLKDGSGTWKCGNPCEFLSNKNKKDGEGICRK